MVNAYITKYSAGWEEDNIVYISFAQSDESYNLGKVATFTITGSNARYCAIKTVQQMKAVGMNIDKIYYRYALQNNSLVPFEDYTDIDIY